MNVQHCVVVPLQMKTMLQQILTETHFKRDKNQIFEENGSFGQMGLRENLEILNKELVW